MSDSLLSILLGIIQGLTEFLPISSSAHLLLPNLIFGTNDLGLSFDIAVHFGTLIAVIFYFKEDISLMLQSLATRNSTFPREKNDPRTIDIDIILFGDSFIETDQLTIPHPGALLRKFVLLPLSELIPEQVFPGTNHKIVDLLNNCPDTSRVSKHLIEKNA